MKNIFLTLKMLIITISIFGQELPSNGTSKLPSLTNMFKDVKDLKGTMIASEWLNTDKFFIKADNVPSIINKYIQDNDTIVGNTISECNLVKKYNKSINLLFHSLTILGNEEEGLFLPFYEQKIPLYFISYKNKDTALILTSIVVRYTYNTLKMTSKQRVYKVIESYVITSLKNFTENFKDADLKYFGISCVYRSEDFSSSYSSKFEYVCFIAPTDAIRKFVSYEITEEELINVSDIFVSDRDMGSIVKKIKINIE